MLLAVDYRLDAVKQVVIVAPGGRAGAEPLLAVLRQRFVPNRVVAVTEPGGAQAELAELVPLVAGKSARDGRATAYVCIDRVCDLPTTEPEELARQLAEVVKLP